MKLYAVELMLVELDTEKPGEQLRVEHYFSPQSSDYDKVLDQFLAAANQIPDMSD